MEIVVEMRGLLAEIKSRELVDQARRAATSIALNTAEGGARKGKDRDLHFSYAAGSARELRSALMIAEAWGYLKAKRLEKVRGLIDQEVAILWRLMHPLPK